MTLKIDLVLVSYNPDLKLLVKTIQLISRQVRQVIVVDNNSTICNLFEELDRRFKKLKIFVCNENLGIATAQNIGIEYSLANNSDYILLTDQDTIFPDNYIDMMLPSFIRSSNVIAASPLFYDAVKQKDNTCFFVSSKYGFSKIYPSGGAHEISQTIASGLLIKSEFLENVGTMDTELFIDLVDYEWCWRALSKGYIIIGNADVVIQHHLGDSAVDIGIRTVNLRSPLRHYYITRNTISLAIRCEYIDIWHRVNLFLKGCSYVIGYSVLSKPRVENIKMTVKGMIHGLKGRLGRLDL